ncbi:Gfo/Idh/MocA family protein [Frigoriglobus tundricola]|uniref:Myo-inositol 2-dehydrogenase n=1 Tax=Frigoriglobus tundricola TaxID=2774151 RepID=A0A6M5YTN8_9BACT|nr:Gfo/Idh/MocA family oxidoreductase [Frigoriglobus tundricola]QJW96786.1 Myo-inositol 2-dehydrogenase [Frigoriglobus tundricola]
MSTSRRAFLATSAVTVAAAPTIFAAGSDVLKVGLIGCGARGTGAAVNALQADKNVKLVAMADAFEDRLTESLENLLKKAGVADKVDVKPEARYVGFDAYKEVIARCDVVLLCTPPQFRPLHLQAAVEAGRHVFCEKPVAVDAPGVRSVLASCAAAKKKNLSVVSGLCIRYDAGFREAVKRIHGGAIGDVVTLFANDYRGGRWEKKRQPDWSDMTYHMRNWYNFTWLSGDFNVEQHVHFLDVCAWVMKDTYPTKAIGMGGRTVLSGPEYGNIYDHFSVVYEYANGARLVSNTRQHPKTKGDMSAHALGTKGRALLSERTNGLTIRAGTGDWVYEGPGNEMYQAEHDELFASIRSGKPINNGEYMAHSTLLAIMGRMAAYTGQEITWKMALESKEDLFKTVLGAKPGDAVPEYDFDTTLVHPPVSLPGVAKYL